MVATLLLYGMNIIYNVTVLFDYVFFVGLLLFVITILI